MKPSVLLVLAIILPATVRAQDQIRIQRIGLQGHYSTAVPSPVSIHIPALAQSQTIHLLLKVDSRDTKVPPPWLRTDQFEKQLPITADKPLDVDLPILLPAYGASNLRAFATDAQGRMIGEASVHPRLLSRDGQNVVAVYCRDDLQCLAAQSQISTPRTHEEQSPPRQDLRIVLLKELESNWLAYRAADVVVIAGSIADMTPDQSKALEYYLRSGGFLVLCEKDTAHSAFLAAYRQSAPGPQGLRVGKGRFFRVSSLESKELDKLFASAPTLGTRKIFANRNAGWQSAPIEWLLARTGVSFTFPHLRWLLIWVGTYILIIGLVNFAVLRRLRKLEWGWVTVSVTALAFAGGLYITSSSHRPKHFTLDGATLYWMDGQSPVALEDLGFRISSPERTHVALTVQGDVLLATGQTFLSGNTSDVYLGSEITGNTGPQEGWVVELAPPLRIETPMRRWSLEDFYAEAFHQFSGTVHWTSTTRLKNDTGQKFRESLYLDLPANKAYSLPEMAPGEEVDLATIIPKDIHGKNPLAAPFARVWGNTRLGRPMEQPFSLKELPYALGGPFPDRFFAGVVEPAGINAGLDAVGTTQQNVAVAIIALDQP